MLKRTDKNFSFINFVPEDNDNGPTMITQKNNYFDVKYFFTCALNDSANTVMPCTADMLCYVCVDDCNTFFILKQVINSLSQENKQFHRKCIHKD